MLAEFGMSLAPSPFRAVLALVVLRAWLAVRGFGFRERDPSAIPASELARVDVCRSVAMGLALCDNIRGAHFQLKYLLLALRAGEPVRVCRALAFEAAFLASQGIARRADATIARAEAIAARLAIARPSSLDVARGMRGWFLGEWRQSLDSFATVLAQVTTTSETRWEFRSSKFFSACAQVLSGDYEGLGRNLALLLREAKDCGDLFVETNLQIGETNLWWLVQDDDVRAEAMVDEAVSRWTREGTQVQDWYELQARASIALYRGDPKAALTEFAERWGALRRFQIVRVELVRGFGAYLRGIAAVAASELAVAEKSATLLQRLGRAWSRAAAMGIRAGIAACRGDASAADAYRRAGEAFDAAEMPAHAAATRARLGRVLGGVEGTRVREEALAALRARGVARPDRFVRVLAAGPVDV
jgi:hypothetical protein